MGASIDIVKAVEQRLQAIEEQLASYDELVRERDRVPERRRPSQPARPLRVRGRRPGAHQ